MTKEKKTIFIVDDNDTNLTAYKEILKPYYVAYPVPSAAKMFELLKQIIPDMILLDIEMPDIDGYEAARTLKNTEGYKKIPIIFLTARTDPVSEMNGLNLGALDYIHKPIVSALLLRRVETHLSLMESQNLLEERNRSIEELLELRTNEVLQRELTESEAKRASDSKSALLSWISHGIHAPLEAISIMLKKAINAADREEIEKCLAKANNTSKYLHLLAGDMLDMANIEAGKFKLSYSNFNLEAALKGIIDMISSRAEVEYKNLSFSLGKSVPQMIHSDEQRLSQVVTNLLTTAVEFIPKNDKISLSTEKTEENGEEFTLKTEIAGFGIGVAEELQRRLSPTTFENAGKNSSAKFGGAGLGFTVSQYIAELMGGRIWIESGPNKGAKIIFTFRAKKAN